MKLTPEQVEALTALTRDYLAPAFRAELREEVKELFIFEKKLQTTADVFQRKLEKLRKELADLHAGIGMQIIEMSGRKK